MNENRIAQFSLMLLFSIAVFSCQSEGIAVGSKTKISFTVDSLKVYPSGQMLNNNFIFSPLTDLDKIWTINSGNSFELDLVTGEWGELSDKYDEGFKRNVREENIWKNHDEREIFVGLFHDCLLYFDLDRDTFYRFEINPVTALISSKDRILVGTAKGKIFNINKVNLETTLESFSCDTWVTKLEVLNDDSLSINDGKFFYKINLTDFKTGTYSSSLVPWYYDRSSTFTQRLPGKQYNTFKDEELTWHFSSKYLFFQDSSNKLYKFHHLPSGNLRKVKNDDKYLYLLFNDKFAILNKTYILKKAEHFDINAFQAKKLSLNRIVNTFYDLEVDSFLQTYSQLKSDDSLMVIPENVKIFQNASIRYFSLFNSDSKKLNDIENALNNASFPEEIEPYALQTLSRYYLSTYKKTKFLFFSEKLKAKYPEFGKGWYQESIQCATRIIIEMDSLSKLNLPTDEWLFKEGLLKKELADCGGFEDNYYNYSRVADNNKQLLLKFPNSEYADNAAFYFIQNYHYGDDEFTYSEEFENKIQNFLLKYPSTELKIEAQRLLAALYSAFRGSQSQNIAFKEKGLAELEKIDLQSMEDSILISYIVQEKNTIRRDMAKEIFDITIAPTKEYKLDDEELIFKVVVKNKTAEIRPLNLFSDNSPFVVNFYSKNEYQYEDSFIKGDSVLLIKNIPPNDSIVDYVNLRSNILNKQYPKGQSIGDFSFSKPGFYYISVSTVDELLLSEQIEFYIHEN